MISIGYTLKAHSGNLHPPHTALTSSFSKKFQTSRGMSAYRLRFHRYKRLDGSKSGGEIGVERVGFVVAPNALKWNVPALRVGKMFPHDRRAEAIFGFDHSLETKGKFSSVLPTTSPMLRLKLQVFGKELSSDRIHRSRAAPFLISRPALLGRFDDFTSFTDRHRRGHV